MADDIPEQVYLDAACAFGISANGSTAGVPEISGHPPFRAAVASAYRAGQASGLDDIATLGPGDLGAVTAGDIAAVALASGGGIKSRELDPEVEDEGS